ncbi:uncharacterized protein SCHCODRAFT_02551638 [Schizophyllum commune H4-8]|uniref:Cyclin N-terminal domain-containing protein n=1 Tax=Schizophyllum commune (strain H4-8 / FGSC 9210) TaxID=578458 RepID=D8QDQ9_SCHCM|nr:uncharacterized protein SCHCODRAFT_02551638 [Schizophyllum commune H4-8]KAI5888614.1 hypothetical protein SCHCODRAFT_02551638 [Schizophyllum commune H4-8]
MSRSLKTTATTRSTRHVHHASLVEPSSHSPVLDELLDLGITDDLVELLVDAALAAIAPFPYSSASSAASSSSVASPSSTSTISLHDPTPYSPYRTHLTDFVHTTLWASGADTPVVHVALAYLQRARGRCASGRGSWPCRRAVLGALVVAAKYTKDAPPKNQHWAMYAGDIPPCSVSQAEREILGALRFDLAITQADLLVHHEALLLRARSRTPELEWGCVSVVAHSVEGGDSTEGAYSAEGGYTVESGFGALSTEGTESMEGTASMEGVESTESMQSMEADGFSSETPSSEGPTTPEMGSALGRARREEDEKAACGALLQLSYDPRVSSGCGWRMFCPADDAADTESDGLEHVGVSPDLDTAADHDDGMGHEDDYDAGDLRSSRDDRPPLLNAERELQPMFSLKVQPRRAVTISTWNPLAAQASTSHQQLSTSQWQPPTAKWHLPPPTTHHLTTELRLPALKPLPGIPTGGVRQIRR